MFWAAMIQFTRPWMVQAHGFKTELLFFFFLLLANRYSGVSGQDEVLRREKTESLDFYSNDTINVKQQARCSTGLCYWQQPLMLPIIE